MLLIAGLGNPGRRYAGHRHNIGFMAVDAIHGHHRFSPWRARFQGETSDGLLAGEKTLLLKPATYMNESGRAVGEAMRYFKLTPADVVVIYDELDLPPGKARLKSGGSSASHRGIRSIEAHIGKAFRRLRLGIGHPGRRDLVNRYVLHDFAKADQEWLEPLITAVAEHMPLVASGEDSTFMNKVHLALADDEGDDVEQRGRERGDGRPSERVPEVPARDAKSEGGGAFASLKRLFGQRS